MTRQIALAFCLAFLIGLTNAQLIKLYKDFDPLDTTDRFNLLSKQGGISYRLPNETRPIRYDIELVTRVDQSEFAFTGIVKIHLRVENTTNQIVIHSKQLTILSTEVKTIDGVLQPTQPHTLDPVTEFLTVATVSGTWLAGSELVLEIYYTGLLRTDDQGFYRSSYVNQTGQTVWLATTQFEQTEARHGFPCYDEPGIRAVYSVRITHGAAYTALANTPAVNRTTIAPGVVTTFFTDTPNMQSYLNAWVVSDFTSVSNAATKLPADTLQSVYARPSVISAGEANFALEAGIKILKALETHLDFNYPIEKMDQIGVPNFYWGAMENWGLVTYRESSLYYNRATQPMSQEDQVTGIVGHEFAHQWFGNIISPAWWEYIWLNEGFATLYSYLSVDIAYPEYQKGDLMLTATCQPVFVQDSYETGRPMNFYVEDPVSVQNLFDFVAYSKAGCVLRMLRYVLSPATFTKGLSMYLKDMQYKAAMPDDLYRNLDAAAQADGALSSGMTVKTMMDSWANQKGFPMITVRRADTGAVTLTQERFLLQKLPTSPTQNWWIPYNFATKSSPDFSKTTPDGWISQSSNSITILPTATQTWTNDDWIIFNKQGTGYYRVNYDTRLWELIIAELVNGEFTQIHMQTRAQLIDDAYNFAQIKEIGYDVVFGLMEYLSKELHYIPWIPADRVLSLVDRMMASLDNYQHLRTYIHHAVQPIFERLGVANIAGEPLMDRNARNMIVRWACYVGSEECRNATTERVKNYISTSQLFEPDNRNVVFCAGMRGADESVFMGLWNKMIASTDGGTRNMLIDALVCSQDEALLKVLLGTLLDTTVVYSAAEQTRILSGVANNGGVGAITAMDFFVENYTAVVPKILLGSTLNNIANWISSGSHLIKLQSLLSRLQSGGTITASQNTAAQTLTQNNIRWVSDFGGSISSFLDNYMEPGSGAIQTVSAIVVLASAILSTLNFLRQ